MSNNFVRDPASIAPDPRRIKSHGAVITLGFGWLHGPVGCAVGLVGPGVGEGALPVSRARGDETERSPDRSGCRAISGLTSRPVSSLSDTNLRAGMKSAITSCGFVVAFGISESVVLPRQ